MEEKKKVGNVAIGMCIIAMIILVGAIVFIAYKYKTDIDSKNMEISNLNALMQEKEEKNEDVSDNTTNNVENNFQEEDENIAKITEKDIIGNFYPMESWPGDSPYIIIEENGKIQLCGNATEYGSYEIDGNEVNVIYSLREGPDVNEEVRENRKEKITVINENVIKTTAIINNETYIGTYVRQEICDEIEEKAKKCIDNQDALKVDYMGIYQINEDNCIFGAYIDSKISYIVFDTSDSNMYKISEVKDEI